MTPPESGGKKSDVRSTSDKLDAAKKEAVAFTEVRKDVEHLGDKVDSLTSAVQALAKQEHRCGKEGDLRMHEGRLDAQNSRMEDIDKRLDWIRGAAVGILLALIGTLTTVLVTCDGQNTRDAETRVMVQTNSVNISKLERSIQKVNEGRDADVRAIVQAVENLQKETKQQSADQWWEALPRHHKSAIIRAVGKHAVPATDSE
jgi:hypothetical protein